MVIALAKKTLQGKRLKKDKKKKLLHGISLTAKPQDSTVRSDHFWPTSLGCSRKSPGTDPGCYHGIKFKLAEVYDPMSIFERKTKKKKKKKKEKKDTP